MKVLTVRFLVGIRPEFQQDLYDSLVTRGRLLTLQLPDVVAGEFVLIAERLPRAPSVRSPTACVAP
jgi:hypothetical protein